MQEMRAKAQHRQWLRRSWTGLAGSGDDGECCTEKGARNEIEGLECDSEGGWVTGNLPTWGLAEAVKALFPAAA